MLHILRCSQISLFLAKNNLFLHLQKGSVKSGGL